MRALKVSGVVALIVGAFLSGQVMASDTVVMAEVTELSAPGAAPVREVDRTLICGEYTWANADMDGCEVLPDYLAEIKNPTIEYLTEYVTVVEYVDRPVTAPVTVRFFEDGSYRVMETGQGGCPPMPLPLLCNAENF
jgi:hypothetical protein